MTTGFGFDACGTTPAGIGEPVLNTALVSPGQNKSTTGAVSSVEIEQSSRDLIVDAYGNERGMNDTDQRVWMCLKTVQGSRMSFGSFGFAPPRLINADIKARVEQQARQALSPVIADGTITFDRVDVVSKGTSVAAVVWYTDNRTRESRSTAYPMRQ